MFENINWTRKNYMLFLDYLFSIKDEKYKKFNHKIVPSINIKKMIGIRVPVLRKIAKDIFKSDYAGFLDICSNEYFEETMIEAIIIGYIKDEKVADKYIKQFIPKIDNWETCDTFASGLKIILENKDKYFSIFKNYIKVNDVYSIRICLVILLNYYVEKDYIAKIFKITDSINSNEYYVNMAIAWLLSMCYIKYPDETINYIVKSNLDSFTYNKTLQKIIESKQITNDTKNYIKSLKK